MHNIASDRLCRELCPRPVVLHAVIIIDLIHITLYDFYQMMNAKSSPDMKSHRPVAYSRNSCDGCAVHDKVLCAHTKKDVLEFLILFIAWFIPFVTGMVIGGFWIGLGIWFGLAVLFFGYIEALVLCRHCPHYAEEGFWLRCHANWGLPKIPRLRSHPMTRFEGAIWLLSGALLFLYYIPYFALSHQWLLLGITTLALILAILTMQKTKCNRCYHLSCPGNRVPEDVRSCLRKNFPMLSESR